MNRNAKVLLVSLAVAAIALWWAAACFVSPPAANDGVRSLEDGASRQPVAAQPALAGAVDPVARVADIVTLSGRVVWGDGAPAFGSEVRIDGMDAVVAVDDAGSFRIDGAPASARALTIWVRPPCWRSAEKFVDLACIAAADDHGLAEPIVLPLQGDVALTIEIPEDLSRALARHAAVGLRAEWSRTPVQGALPIPVRVRTDRFPFGAHSAVVVRLPFGDDHRCSVQVDGEGGARLELGTEVSPWCASG